MHYKDSQNKLYWLEAGEDPVRWLPKGCISITDEEAEALRPKPPEPTYQELRAAAYPPATDYLDAIVKGDEKALQAYVEACLAVKAKYPK